jgi:hypothetical protein
VNKESFIVGCIRRLREYGVAMILADQSISSLKEVVKSCVYTIICLSQTSQKDRREAASVLGLASGIADIINRLEVGEGIIRLAGRYPFPQLLTFPLIKPKHISDDEIDKLNANDERINMLLGTATLKPDAKVDGLINPQPDKPEKEAVSNNMKKFIWAVYVYQYKKSKTEIYVLSGLKTGTADRVSRQCETNHFIKIITPSFGKSKYPVLLPEGYKILGLDEVTFYGKGAGDEHVLWQYQIAEHFSELHPKIEFFKGSKHIDIAIETRDRLIAIEVAMTAANEKNNIEKDFELARADYLIIACINEKVKLEIEKILSDFPERITKQTDVMHIKEVLKMNLING